MQLNKEQQEAVNSHKGFYCCQAIPGSGKTETFSQRARAIWKKGCPPENFIGLTFNKSAALEFEQRSGFKQKAGGYKPFRTFHGLALDFVVTEHQNFPFEVQRWPLLTPFEQYQVLGPIVKHAPRRVKYKDVLFAISQFKRKSWAPDRARREATGEFGTLYAELYGQYEAKCKHTGKMDFDSLMVETVNLLESQPGILARWQPEYVQNDEAQDNDSTQWRLLQLLSKRAGNVFCVGDPNQNMYTWRGAEPDGMAARFEQRFPGARRLILTENYRSTGAIVAYCEKIAPTPTPMRTSNDYGVDPVFRRYLTEDAEAETIISQMIDRDNTAILARTNQQLSAFERVCGEKEIKYKLLGKSGFFHQEEIQCTLAFAQYFVSPTDACIKQIIKSPYDCARFMKKGEIIERLEDLQRGTVGYQSFTKLLGQFRHHDSEQTNKVLDLHRKLQYTAELIKGKSAEGALRAILTQFGILHHYEDNVDADNNPANNVRTLLRMTEKHSTLMAFVNSCIKAKAASRSTAKRLTLSTVHQAKGKEWSAVYVVGVNHEMMPHKNGDPDEEKRIYFVACSRAALHLYVSCYGEPSPFIKSLVAAAPLAQKEVDVLDMMYRAQGVE